MARDLYAPRRDYAKLGSVIVGALGLIFLALLAFKMLKPTNSEADAKAGAELTRQMDEAQARDGERRGKSEAERQGALL